MIFNEYLEVKNLKTTKYFENYLNLLKKSNTNFLLIEIEILKAPFLFLIKMILVNYSDSEEDEKIQNESSKNLKEESEESSHSENEEQKKNSIPLPDVLEAFEEAERKKSTIPAFLKNANFSGKKKYDKEETEKKPEATSKSSLLISEEEDDEEENPQLPKKSYPENIDFSVLDNEEVEELELLLPPEQNNNSNNKNRRNQGKRNKNRLNQNENNPNKKIDKREKRRGKNLVKDIEKNSRKNRGNMGSSWRTETSKGRWKSKEEMNMRQQFD